MPLTIPPFVAYQAPLIPVATRWRTRPPEGDKLIACEIDWGVTAPVNLAVQFALNAGPVEFSQLVAFSVDNGRNGADVDFIFPDTGKQLTIPAYSQGVYPVFTNAMTFYVLSVGAAAGDVTVFECLNSVPPPVSVLPSAEQSHAGSGSVSLNANSSTPILPAGTTGTLQTVSLVLNIQTGASPAFQAVTVTLQDGTGTILWQQGFQYAASTTTVLPINQTGLRLRFVNGLNLVISGTTMTAGAVTANLYYSTP